MEEWFAIPHLASQTCMFMSRIARVVAILLIPVLVSPETAFARKPLTPEKAKEKITLRGVGHSVRLVLMDKSVVRGKIAKIGSEDVEIGLEGSGQIQPIAYSQVREYHDGRLSKTAKIATGVAGGVLAGVVLWTLYILGRDD